MSECSVKQIINRVRSASKDSPIAVFKLMGKKELDAVFAATLPTQERIKTNDPLLMGVFYNGLYTEKELVNILERAIAEQLGE